MVRLSKLPLQLTTTKFRLGKGLNLVKRLYKFSIIVASLLIASFNIPVARSLYENYASLQLFDVVRSTCLAYNFLLCSSGMNIIDSVLPALPYIQIILSILLVAAILLQQRGSSLGGAFGGDNFSSAFHKRRGAEQFLFKFSIGISILFVFSTFLNILA